MRDIMRTQLCNTGTPFDGLLHMGGSACQFLPCRLTATSNAAFVEGGSYILELASLSAAEAIPTQIDMS